MVLKSFHTDTLDKICSKDQSDLLDSIDFLRSQGISHYVSLPQIIVCGDQSSGKSSVLEAISGVSFPVKSSLATRFPTELVLRKTSQVGASVSIVPHQDRSESERLTLGNFHQELEGFDGLPDLIESAKVAMGILPQGKAFSKDLLRVEISGPDRPHLTIVDLPGLIHSETKQQSDLDITVVQDIVQSYMKESRSIILAVVSAKNDFANQIVLKLARAADKKGKRTLGVITKPDYLVPGSGSEAMYASLAKNQEVEFRLGWHVLRNKDSEKEDWSLAERDAVEENFFSEGIWKEMPSLLLGVDKLRGRLSKLLLEQIAAELPSLINDIEAKSNTYRSRLNKLGKPRATLAEQQLYLFQLSQSFQSLVKAAVDGTYNDPFFEDAQSLSGYQKRIRALIHNSNQDFAKKIARKGHRREVTDLTGSKGVSRGVTSVTRNEFLVHIERLMKRTRGRELPGTFSPMIVSDLFFEQSTPWEEIARKHIDKVWKAGKEFLTYVVTYTADDTTTEALLQNIFDPALDQLLESLREKTTEMLIPHQKGHPITYNHYFTENLQKFRNQRNQDEYSKIVKQFFGVSSLEGFHYDGLLNPSQLVSALVQRTEPDMNRFACSEALDCMEAYYNVAMKRFIDDIAIEVIEMKLLCPLGGIFTPVAVSVMPTDVVTRIAGESEENRTERDQLTKKLNILSKGLETCQRFIGVRLLDADDDAIKSDHESDNNPTRDGSEKSDALSSTDEVLKLSEIVMEDPEPAPIGKIIPLDPSSAWSFAATPKKNKKISASEGWSL